MLDAVSSSRPFEVPSFAHSDDPIENLFTFHKWLFDPVLGSGELQQLFRSYIEEVTAASGIFEFMPIELGILQALYCHVYPNYSTISAVQQVADSLYQRMSCSLQEEDPPASPKAYFEVDPNAARSFGEMECRESAFPRAIVAWPVDTPTTDLFAGAVFEHEVVCRYLLDQQKLLDSAFNVLRDVSVGEILVDALAIIHLGPEKARMLALYSLRLEPPDEKLLACTLGVYRSKRVEEWLHSRKDQFPSLSYWRSQVDTLLEILSKYPVKELGECTILEVLSRDGFSKL